MFSKKCGVFFNEVANNTSGQLCNKTHLVQCVYPMQPKGVTIFTRISLPITITQDSMSAHNKLTANEWNEPVVYKNFSNPCSNTNLESSEDNKNICKCTKSIGAR